jgi:hypothetical protein
MNVAERIARVLVVVLAVASGLVVHFWLLLWVALGVCGRDGSKPDAAACNESIVLDAWYALVATGEIGMVVAGCLWIAGRDAAAPLAFAWLLTLCVGILPVVAFEGA